MKTSIKSRLDDLLKTSGLSEYDLAKASGVEYTTIHRIITGDTANPSKNTLAPIAAALDTSVEYLRTGTGKKETVSEKSLLSRALDRLEQQIDKKDQTIESLTKVLLSLTGGKGGDSNFLRFINNLTAPQPKRLARAS